MSSGFVGHGEPAKQERYLIFTDVVEIEETFDAKRVNELLAGGYVLLDVAHVSAAAKAAAQAGQVMPYTKRRVQYLMGRPAGVASMAEADRNETVALYFEPGSGIMVRDAPVATG